MFPIYSKVFTDSTQSGVLIQSIPQTYTHLKIFVFGRGTSASSMQSASVVCNNDFSSQASQHRWAATGSFGQDNFVSGSGGYALGGQPTSADPANTYGAWVVDILDYTNTSKYKLQKVFGGAYSSGFQVYYATNNYMNTSAVSSLWIGSAGNFAQYSRIDVYGIAGSPATGA